MADYENLNLNVQAVDNASIVLDKVINKLDKIQSLVKSINFKKISVGSSNKSLEKMALSTQKVNSSIKKLSNNTKVANVAQKDFSRNITKSIVSIQTLKAVASIVSNIVNESGDWIESLNLFEVTMGQASKSSLNFGKTLVNNFRVSYNETIKYMGLFTQMASAIGIVEKVAVDLGSTMTALGYDIASFYNRSTTSTNEMIRAAIAGQTKPARQYGFDITAQSLDKYIRERFNYTSGTSKELDQNSKALLRMILILDQSRNAWGDMSKTINTFQNQVKVMIGSFKNLGLAIGDYLIKPATSFVTIMSAIAIAATDILRLFKPLTETSGLNETTQSIASMGAEVEELQESLGLLNIDKFNVLKKGSDVLGDSALDQMIQEEYWKLSAEYTAKMEENFAKIKNNATIIADKIKSAFVNVDENGNFVGWTTGAKALGFTALTTVLYSLISKITAVIKTAGLLTKALNVSKVASTASTITAGGKIPILTGGSLSATGVGTSALLTPKVALIAAAVAILAGTIVKMYNQDEDFRKSINNIFKNIKNIIEPALDLMSTMLKGIFDLLSPVLDLLEWWIKTFAKFMEWYTDLFSTDEQEKKQNATKYTNTFYGNSVLENDYQKRLDNIKGNVLSDYDNLIDFFNPNNKNNPNNGDIPILVPQSSQSQGDIIIQVDGVELARATNNGAKKIGLKFSEV